MNDEQCRCESRCKCTFCGHIWAFASASTSFIVRPPSDIYIWGFSECRCLKGPENGPFSEVCQYSECKAQRSLEIPLDRGTGERCSALAPDLAELRSADGQIGGVRLRMVQNVRGIHSER
jgi:hypothetical protein